MRIARLLTAAALFAAPVSSLLPQTPPDLAPDFLAPGSCPRVADPKLTSGAIPVTFFVTPPGHAALITVRVLQNNVNVRTLMNAVPTTGGTTPVALNWDGRNSAGRFVSPGSYQIVVSADKSPMDLSYPVTIVRLGIKEIAALGNAPTASEWQMVYFKKGTLYSFYAVPATHEYLNVADTGEIAELDLNNGSPRPPAPLHTATDQPRLEGSNYEDDSYNYPACYLAGTAPKLAVKFGATCVGSAGAQAGAGYPLAGLSLRCVATDGDGNAWSNTDSNIVPSTAYNFIGTPLRTGVTRTDVALTWSWLWSVDGGSTWNPIPGSLRTQHRFYTIAAAPVWAAGAFGTQHSGPWVEVVDDIVNWSAALNLGTATPAAIVETLVKGFSGQIPPLTTAIEGVMYDCFPLGGDSGASHYYLGFPPTNTTQLSHLLNSHGNGVFLNCSDCASCTTGMLGMVGVSNMQMMRLGQMTLRAIRGIGAPSYTLNLWGGVYAHAFGYHHIITRNAGVQVSDACLWVDVDVNPNALPGTPGYNVERSWTGGPSSYMSLAASNFVSYSLDPLPFLQ